MIDAAPGAGRWLAGLIAAVTVLVATIIAASRGVLPGHGLVAGILVTASLLAAIVLSYGLIDALGAFADVRASSRPIERILSHPSLWLLGLAVLLYVPFLGNFGLIDPWETHYGEVSREILARDDWMSLWWAQDGWFNSKPIFNFGFRPSRSRHSASIFTRTGLWAPSRMVYGLNRSGQLVCQ